MPILTIRHVTIYHYRRPVSFGEHRIMLRQRDDDDQKVLKSELEITPEPSQLTWTRDIFGNHVATARFADRASELRFESTIRVDHAPTSFCAADIEDFARTHPFAYAAEDRPGLARFTTLPPPHPMLKRWAARFLRKDGSADTRELLVDMTRTIERTFRHVARHEKGTQGRVEMWRGFCRLDISVSAPFVWRCLSGSTMAPFPHPAHRTGQADFPHPALGQDLTPSPTARRARAPSSVRARSARKGARVDKSRPCFA